MIRKYTAFGEVLLTTTTFSSHAGLVATVASGFRTIGMEFIAANISSADDCYVEILETSGVASTVLKTLIVPAGSELGWQPPGGQYLTAKKALRARLNAASQVRLSGTYITVRSPT